jgi:hypothetical protein
MPDRFTLAPFEFFAGPTCKSFPFPHGIASMMELPHLFVRTMPDRVHGIPGR